MKLRTFAVPVLLVASCVFSSAPAMAAPCESLASLVLPNTTITLTQMVKGTFTASGGLNGSLPAFCRIAATLKPTNDSDIKMEVWLPASDWNGKYQAVGNVGWAGAISYPAMVQALLRGYATSSTDTGHSGGGGGFALGHPEKLIDYAYRSEHEMTVKAKAIIQAFYGRSARFSYWNGCSAGGRQGLKEAQMYPQDFDGIIAGAPALNWTGRAIQSMWIAQALHNDPRAYIPPSKYPLIHDAVLDQCDAQDGVQDRVLENPASCKFDPGVLQCRDGDSASCLIAPQVDAARKIYTAPVNPRTGQKIFPGLELGSELGWANLGGAQPFVTGADHFKFVVFKDPNWDFKTLNFDSDVAVTLKTDSGMIDAMNPDLKAFFGRGGKLLQYHGWADQQISPQSSVDYYQSVVEMMGATTVKSSYRLFMVPGMGHCGGGDGTDTFDAIGVLEQWVEKGKAPERIRASHVTDDRADRTRPLCPYPQVAVYKGRATPTTHQTSNVKPSSLKHKERPMSGNVASEYRKEPSLSVSHGFAAPIDDLKKKFSKTWKKTRSSVSEKDVHALRVCTRRITAVLGLSLGVSADKKTERLRRRYSKVLKRLGPMRDLQVELGLLSDLGAPKRLKKFVRDLKRREDQESGRIQRYLRWRRRRDLVTKMARLSERFEGAEAERVVRQILASQVHEFVVARGCFDPLRQETLHPMRIALKKLRYVAEAAAPFLDPSSKIALLQMQNFQKLTGDIRDIQILRARLDKWTRNRSPETRDAGRLVIDALDQKSSRLMYELSRSSIDVGPLGSSPEIPSMRLSA